MAFYFPNKGQGEFFYSYVQVAHKIDPKFSSFMESICKGYKMFTYNSKRLQGPLSNVFGQYCLHYIFHRARGYSGNDIIEQLGPDPVYSNFLVKYFIDNKL